MKLKITLVKETEAEVDIQFPVYLWDRNSVYYKFVSPTKCFIVKQYNFARAIEWTHHTYLNSRFMDPAYQVITKEEFGKAFNDTKIKLENALNEVYKTE